MHFLNKPMRRFISVAAVAFMLPSVSARAHDEDIRSTFNLGALTAEYAQDCATRESIRSAHILPPYDPATPAAFRVKDREFLKASPYLTRKEKKAAEESFRNLAPHIKDLAYLQGVVYVAPRVIAEAQPGLAGDAGYYNDYGLYRLEERRAYLPLAFARINVDSHGRPVAGRDGKIIRRFTESTRDRLRMITHESGHAVDDILGHFSRDNNADHRLTSRADFIAAFDRDLDALARIPNVSRNEDIIRRGYYLPAYHDGVYIGGLREENGEVPQRNRREVFAELWAEINSHSTRQLSVVYPRTFALVKKFNAMLKELHDDAPAQCRYTPDGRALPLPESGAGNRAAVNKGRGPA